MREVGDWTISWPISMAQGAAAAVDETQAVADDLPTVQQELAENPPQLEPWYQEPLVGQSLGVLALVLAALVANAVARWVVIPLIHKAVSRTRNDVDDVLFDDKVVSKLSWLAGAAVVYYVPGLVPDWLLNDRVEAICLGVANAVMILSVTLAIAGVLDAVNTLYARREASKARPIKGYVQIIKLAIYAIGIVLVIAELLDKDPVVFITGLGAFAAVLMLIFKDTILSLVAAVQISSHDIVRVGDWIEIPSLGVDGDVMDIALHTVKVRNFDKTVSTVPTSAIVHNTVKNWRGMQESGGRRIKRSLVIDLSTIRFLDQDEITRFRRFEVLRQYMDGKLEEIDQFNKREVGPEMIANARRLTNVGTLRAYIIGYLRAKPDIHQDGMTFLIRQLQPTEAGLPIEIYVFTTTTNWVEYEGVQADIFDHLLAMVPEFGLRVYQKPSGADLAGALGDAAAS